MELNSLASSFWQPISPQPNLTKHISLCFLSKFSIFATKFHPFSTLMFDFEFFFTTPPYPILCLPNLLCWREHLSPGKCLDGALRLDFQHKGTRTHWYSLLSVKNKFKKKNESETQNSVTLFFIRIYIDISPKGENLSACGYTEISKSKTGNKQGQGRTQPHKLSKKSSCCLRNLLETNSPQRKSPWALKPCSKKEWFSL